MVTLKEMYKASCEEVNEATLYSEAWKAVLLMYKLKFKINDKVRMIEDFDCIDGVITGFEVDRNKTIFAIVDFKIEVYLVNINYLEKVEE